METLHSQQELLTVRHDTDRYGEGDTVVLQVFRDIWGTLRSLGFQQCQAFVLQRDVCFQEALSTLNTMDDTHY